MIPSIFNNFNILFDVVFVRLSLIGIGNSQIIQYSIVNKEKLVLNYCGIIL